MSGPLHKASVELDAIADELEKISVAMADVSDRIGKVHGRTKAVYRGIRGGSDVMQALLDFGLLEAVTDDLPQAIDDVTVHIRALARRAAIRNNN